MLLLILVVALAAAPSSALETEECLGCHGDADSVGEELTIAEAAFAATPHAEMGCAACHGTLDDRHPDEGVIPQRAACDECHSAVAAEYATSVHAGNAGCSDCHNPHAVRAQDEVSGDEMNRPCAFCHDAALMAQKHQVWLPQTQLHLSALPCISCHSGSERLALNLYLIHATNRDAANPVEPASFAELTELSGGATPASLINGDGNQVISLSELRDFNRDAGKFGLRLHGMMVPASPSHSYDILYNRWDCTFCHGAGPGTQQTSFLHVPNADGSYRRIPVENGAVLAVLYTTPDFYMVGATRNTGLNVAGAMLLAGGLVMPIGHGLLRFLTRKNRHG
ncbi:multiheme c-type cytochrome [Desulfuromonas carbonis]